MLHYLNKNRLWAPDDRVVLSVSGGVDSMVLLDIMAKTQRAHRGILQVLTFNHGLRVESETETHLVKQRCRTLGLPCNVKMLNVSSGSHLQERARQARLKEYSSQSSVVATGHHADDQAETLLFRLLRGSGPTGLRAMLPKQGQMVRPLLFAHKTEILRYATDNNVQWLDDPSNPNTARGRLRKIFPLLSTIRENPVEVLARTARVFAREEEFMTQIIEEQYQVIRSAQGLSLSILLNQHPAVQIRLIRRWLREYNISPSAVQMEAFLESSKKEGCQIQLSRGHRLFVTNRNLTLVLSDK